MPGPRDGLTAFWRGLAPGLRERLLLGSCGQRHLLDAARAALALGSPVAPALVLASLAEGPLDGGLAAEILAAPDLLAALPGAVRPLLASLSTGWKRPEDVAGYEELAAGRDLAALRRFLDSRLDRGPSLFWLNQSASLALFENDQDWLAASLARPLPSALAPALEALRGQAAFLRGDFAAADRHYAAALVLGPSILMRRGLCRRALGDEPGAVRLFLACLEAAPWHATAALLASEPPLPASAPIPGSLAVLLYSWNKAAELDATLAALFASDLGGARVIALDNGSTDATAEVLSAWAGRSGGRLARVDLPVNVGAAAARNWLAALPEVRAADFALYVDDDAEVPPNWLGLLGAAVTRWPEASVWGCRVVDHAGPWRIQAADLHPVLPEPPDPQRPEEFRFSDLHIQDLDMGQFTYARPCVSVTGCCHLFRSATPRRSGGFSLHLSPSQYDDVEHDLRLARAGGFAVYQGRLAVRHRKRTGAAGRTSRAEHGNALGNKFKMQAMHPRAGMEAVVRADRDRLLEDLLARLAALPAPDKEHS
ncbi:glycosyltransferase family 2 protein [Desulfovibrio sp.]